MHETIQQLQPQSQDIPNQAGITLFENKHYEEALLVWQKMIAANPTDAHAHLWIGDTLFHLQRYDESLEAYRAASEHDPQDVFAVNRQGMCFSELERWEEAVAAYRSAFEMNPQHEQAYKWLVNVGITLDYLGRYAEAEKAYKQALLLCPDDVDAQINMGACYGWQGRRMEAIGWYKKAAKLGPANTLAHTNLKGSRRNHRRKYVNAQHATSHG